jgi:hypothetical protein
MTEATSSTISHPRNDDLRFERDRLNRVLDDTDLDQKEYRKAVESVRKTADLIEKLKSK